MYPPWLMGCQVEHGISRVIHPHALLEDVVAGEGDVHVLAALWTLAFNGDELVCSETHRADLGVHFAVWANRCDWMPRQGAF